MPLDDIVIPNLITTLADVTGPIDGMVRSVHYGEQFQIAQAPVCWILNAGASFPEKVGSDREQSDWSIELKLLYPFANDQTNAENVLGALIEPFRQCFRRHLKMGAPLKIARARILSASWAWGVVGDNVYRTCSLRLGVREKISVHFNP
jgi:hypothetical protein